MQWCIWEHECSSQQGLHRLGAGVRWAACVFMPSQVPSGQRVENCAILGCSSGVFGAPSSPLCQWEQCRLGRGRLRNGWALWGLCWALSWLLLARIGERHNKSEVGESAFHNHDVTPKVRAAVTSQREEGGCCSTRKFCLCHHEGKHLRAAWPLECSWGIMLFRCQKRGARLCYFLSPYVTASELEWICISINTGKRETLN